MVVALFVTGQNGSPAEINRGTVAGSGSVVSSVRLFISAAEERERERERERAIARNAALWRNLFQQERREIIA